MNKYYIHNLKNTIKDSFAYTEFKQFLGIRKKSYISNDENIILNIIFNQVISNNRQNIFEDQFGLSIIGNISLTDEHQTPHGKSYVILNVHFNNDFKETFNINDAFVTINLSKNESFYNDVETIFKELSIIFDDVNSNIQSVFDDYQRNYSKKESKFSVATVKNVAKMFGFE